MEYCVYWVGPYDEYLMYVRGTESTKGYTNVKDFFTKSRCSVFPFGRMGRVIKFCCRTEAKLLVLGG